MPGCCAPNCYNSSRKGFRLFAFPRAPERRQRWTINCRRYKWKPSMSARLCETHFESSQFENNRQDGRKLLKHNAVPTIFDVPNPPKRLDIRRSLPTRRGLQIASAPTPAAGTSSPADCGMAATADAPLMNTVAPKVAIADVEIANARASTDPPLSEIDLLKSENTRLRKELRMHQKQQGVFFDRLAKFLHEDQLDSLGKKPSSSLPWSEETIMDCLNMQIVIGSKAYEFLRNKGYPLPSKSTLARWAKINCPQGSLDTDSKSDDHGTAQDRLIILL